MVDKLESFQDASFLQTHVLDNENVLEYFYQSTMFDTNSINQARRRGLKVTPDADGVEYLVIHSNLQSNASAIASAASSGVCFANTHGLFVIQKQQRIKGSVTPLQIFYCLGGIIYPAPSFAGVIYCRLRAACEHLATVLQTLEKMVQWSLLTGFAMRRVEENDDSVNEKEKRIISQIDIDNDDDDDHYHDVTMDEEEQKKIPQKDADTNSIIRRPITMSSRKLKVIEGSKRDQGVIVVFDEPEPTRFKAVVEAEYGRLFKANTRLVSLFTKDVESRQEAEQKYRNLFEQAYGLIEQTTQLQMELNLKLQNMPFWLAPKSISEEASSSSSSAVPAISSSDASVIPVAAAVPGVPVVPSSKTTANQ